MKKGILAIYDSNADYAVHLMDYVNRKRDFCLEACVFTNVESLLEHTKNSEIDILLVGEDCNLAGICGEHIRHTVVLSEEKYVREDMEMPAVYKFQQANQLLKEVLTVMLGDKPQKDGYLCIGKKTECVGFFSASGGNHRTSLALAVGQMLAQKAEVLYLNFELLPSMEPRETKRTDLFLQAPQGMSELLYYIRQGNDNIPLKIKTMAEDIGGLSCILPVNHYRDLYDMKPEDVDRLFGELRNTGIYEQILVDVGFLGDAAWAILGYCEKIIVPQASGSISDARMKGLLDMLRAEGREELCEKFVPVQDACDENFDSILQYVQK